MNTLPSPNVPYHRGQQRVNSMRFSNRLLPHDGGAVVVNIGGGVIIGYRVEASISLTRV
jgi:hypothetical protein